MHLYYPAGILSKIDPCRKRAHLCGNYRFTFGCVLQNAHVQFDVITLAAVVRTSVILYATKRKVASTASRSPLCPRACF